MINEVYLIYSDILDLYKIGVSKNSKKRIKNLQTGSPYKLKIIYSFKSKFSYKIEKMLHKKFIGCKQNIDDDKIEGEWFNLEINDVKNFIKECEKLEKTYLFLENSDNLII